MVDVADEVYIFTQETVGRGPEALLEALHRGGER